MPTASLVAFTVAKTDRQRRISGHRSDPVTSTRPMRPTRTSLTRIVRSVAILIAATTVNTAVATSAQTLRCDLSGYTARTGVTAELSGDLLVVEWEGAGDEWLRMKLGIADRMPVVAELAVRVDQRD